MSIQILSIGSICLGSRSSPEDRRIWGWGNLRKAKDTALDLDLQGLCIFPQGQWTRSRGVKPACQDSDGQGTSAFPPLSSSPNNVFSQHQWDEVGRGSTGLRATE